MQLFLSFWNENYWNISDFGMVSGTFMYMDMRTSR
jgi:hypothetical protein